MPSNTKYFTQIVFSYGPPPLKYNIVAFVAFSNHSFYSIPKKTEKIKYSLIFVHLKTQQKSNAATAKNNHNKVAHLQF